MFHPGIANRTARLLCVALLALIVAVRLLTPAGFMPTFDQGAVTIVPCPDGEPAPPPMNMPGHHHHGPRTLHQSCPYASAAELGGLAVESPPPVALLAIGIALLLGRAFVFIERQRAHDRPPLRGPPIPA